jgi:hypothetical protein
MKGTIWCGKAQQGSLEHSALGRLGSKSEEPVTVYDICMCKCVIC